MLSSIQREISGVVRSVHLPPPLKGWNTRDPVSEMSPLYALQLDNLFPDVNALQVRNGCTSFATRAAAGTIESMYSFQSNTTGVSKLFVCTDNGIYDASAGGAMAAAVTALTNGQIEMVNFTNSAGTNFLWGVNGADKVKTYNGTLWGDLDGVSVPAITGVTVQNLNFCFVFKRRIMCIEKNSMNLWFLPTDSIAGAASKFPVGGLFHRGGYLLAGASWTIDGGSGPDDYCVLLTSEGEIAVYQGTDPSTSASFALVGVFYVGRPAGRRSLVRLGGDIAVISEMGLIPLSKITQGFEASPKVAFSDVISPSWGASVRAFLSTPGWGATQLPSRNALIINVPTSATTAWQFVWNMSTGAWCRFLGWNAFCFTTHNGELYYGAAAGVVYKAWTGATDGGQPIVAQAVQAYTTFNKGGGTLQVKLARPIVSMNGGVEERYGLYVDFDPTEYSTVIPPNLSIVMSPWDISPWDTSFWSTGSSAITPLAWRHIPADPGFYVALALQFSSSLATLISWAGTDFQVIDGAVM